MIVGIDKVERVNRQICKADGSSNPKCNDGVCAVTGINEYGEFIDVGYVCQSLHRNQGWQLRYPNHEYVKSGACGFNKFYGTKEEAVEALMDHVNDFGVI
ncbi:MAG: hypothetical protein QGH83_03145 [Candidatus Pacebacteria bacterium]|jgi:hypothetical protein|nr:hypothetical protein [Candidatus Paceibacterota bacterium]